MFIQGYELEGDHHPQHGQHTQVCPGQFIAEHIQRHHQAYQEGGHPPKD